MSAAPTHKTVQSIAKSVLSQLRECITPQSTEASLAHQATVYLAEAGITQTWYHNTPALVLLGQRSCLSVSGRDDQPAEEPVGQLNLVTIDLSPQNGDIWGDCARSFFVESGRVMGSPTHPEFIIGQQAQRALHQAMQNFVTPDTRCHTLYEFGRDTINALGFENLDFNGNLGHSIPTRLSDRIFIESNTTTRLGDLAFFTFEPHIRQRGGHWGFKHEDIYYFDPDGLIQRL